MDICEAKKGDVMVVEIIGRADSNNADVLRRKLVSLAESEKSILIDCAGLEYISSAGLGVLLLSLKTMQKKGGVLRLCCLNERIREVFDISGFTQIFTILAAREDALRP